MRALAAAILLVAGCGAGPRPIDVDRGLIRDWINAYCEASIGLGRGDAARRPEMDGALDRLLRMNGDPDGRRYVQEALVRRRAAAVSLKADLAALEQAELDRRPAHDASELNRLVRQRYDCELTVAALERLSAALPQ